MSQEEALAPPVKTYDPGEPVRVPEQVCTPTLVPLILHCMLPAASLQFDAEAQVLPRLAAPVAAQPTALAPPVHAYEPADPVRE